MFHKVNAEGTTNMLKAIIQKNPEVKRFVQVSSAAASGPSESQTPIDEDHPPNPLTVYGKSKLEGEKIAIGNKDKVPVVVLRPSGVYGPRDREMLSFFKIIKFGIKPTFGKGECYVNFTYVEDFARAVVKSIESDVKSGSVYFVTEKRMYSYSQAADIVSDVLGSKAIDIHVPTGVLKLAGGISERIAKYKNEATIFTAEKAIELSQKYWLVSSDRIERDMGFVAPTSFRDGVEKTVRWYREKNWL